MSSTGETQNNETTRIANETNNNDEEICEACDRIYKGRDLDSVGHCENCGCLLCPCEEHDLSNSLCTDCFETVFD